MPVEAAPPRSPGSIERRRRQSSRRCCERTLSSAHFRSTGNPYGLALAASLVRPACSRSAPGCLWRQLGNEARAARRRRRRDLAGARAAGRRRARSSRSASGKARCWSSISGRPGACRAARRCREFVKRAGANSAPRGCNLSVSPSISADKVRQFADETRAQLSGADRRLRRDRAVQDARQPAQGAALHASSSIARDGSSTRSSGRSKPQNFSQSSANCSERQLTSAQSPLGVLRRRRRPASPPEASSGTPQRLRMAFRGSRSRSSAVNRRRARARTPLDSRRRSRQTPPFGTLTAICAGDDRRFAKIGTAMESTMTASLRRLTDDAMDLRKLKTLIELVESSGIAELEIQEGEERVRITRARRRPAPTATVAAAAADAARAGRAAGRVARAGSRAGGAGRAGGPRGQEPDGRHVLPRGLAGREAVRRGRRHGRRRATRSASSRR